MRKREALRRVADVIRGYGIRVNFGKLPAGFTGDLDGESITLDPSKLNDGEMLFTAAHLFAHTVQWSVSPRLRRLGLLEVTPPVPEPLLSQLRHYELDAAGYGLQVLSEAGIWDLDHWYTSFALADIEYLCHYYRTGRKKPMKSFWRDHPLKDRIEPRKIPSFKPKFRGGRNGVVI